MNVYIYNDSLNGGHGTRGIGSYTRELIQGLREAHDVTLTLSTETPSGPLHQDIIHYPYFDLFFRSLSIPQSIPTVVTIHDVIPLVYPDKFPAGIKANIALFFQKRMLQNASAIVTDSDCSKNDIVNYLNVSEDLVHVVPLAPAEGYTSLSSKQIKALDLEKKYALPASYVLYVGDVNWNKNIQGLLEAFATVSKTELELVLVGKAFHNKELPEVQQIETIIDNCSIRDRVHMLGYVPEEDLVGIYNMATAYVQPSHYEGFGFPVIEAMACGTPVVSTTSGSLNEILSEAVIRVTPNAHDIASGIKKACSLTKKQRQEVSETNSAYAKTYSWKRVVEHMQDIYHSCI